MYASPRKTQAYMGSIPILRIHGDRFSSVLEPSVLPTEVELDAMGTGTNVCCITAPTCQYGSAVYRAQMRFALGGSIMEVDGEEMIAAGACTECILDIEYPCAYAGQSSGSGD